MLEHFNLSKKLHTDVLEEKYGPIRSEVIRHDDEVREVKMIDESGISRTYALTFFTFDRSNKEVLAIDEEIKRGGLIGKVFREHGYEVRKNVISVFVIDMPDFLKKDMGTEDVMAKVRLSEFYAKKEEGEPIIYGVVSEIYSPDFRPAEINEVDKAQNNPTTEAMEEQEISKKEIWDRLGDGNDFSDVKDKFDKANEASLSKEDLLKERVIQYLKHHEI